MKENKCSVQFICHGANARCKHFLSINDTLYNCAYEIDGNCTKKTAQIESLLDEGFEVKE
jgi:hypothetical protein